MSGLKVTVLAGCPNQASGMHEVKLIKLQTGFGVGDKHDESRAYVSRCSAALVFVHSQASLHR